MDSVTAGATMETMSELEQRRVRMEELWDQGEVSASRYFAMRFFHGIESTVKARCSAPGPRAGYDFVKDSLHARTLARGHACAAFLEGGGALTSLTSGLDPVDWERLGLEIPAEALAGFASILEEAAEGAAADAGVDTVQELKRAFLHFVRLEASVRVAPGADQRERDPLAVGKSLGGEPDSGHFFSFAELALTQVAARPASEFWIAAARGAVAAQPVYLALHFLAQRRAPRKAVDYGPGDILDRPRELLRRLELAPAVEDLSVANAQELAALAGRNAHRGLIGAGHAILRMPRRVSSSQSFVSAGFDAS